MENKNKVTILLSLIVVSLITIAIILAVFFLPGNNVKMINLNDKTVEEVKTFLTDNKIDETRYELIYEYSETVAKDKVISQSVEEGKKLDKKTLLTIVISNGKDPNLEVSIPDFTNKSEDEIKTWFDNNFFSDITFEYVISDKIEKGKFVSSNIDNNLQKRSALIVISISAGKDAIGIEIDMPDFKDYTKANIQAWGKNNNVTVVFKNEASTKIKEGGFISQNPQAGSKIKTGDKITVTLSLGDGLKATNFAGKKQNEAEKWIKANGLKASYIQVYDAKVKEGIIISNTPNKGTIKKGTTVQFNVSAGLVPIENYTNKLEKDFNSYISKLNASYNKSANIKVKVIQEESDKPSGTIIQQSVNNQIINAATKVAPSSVITIKIAKIGVKKVTVDNKAGISENDFKKYLSGLGLVVGNKIEKYDDSKAAGIIISNDTGNVDINTRINYVVSLGQFSLNPAIFNNKPYGEVEKTIKDANAKNANWKLNNPEYKESNTVKKGNVISCSVNSKTLICQISSGAKVEVKNFHNQDKPCNSSCNIDGIIYRISGADYHDTIAANKVISQSIAAGTKVNEGTEVTLTISKGKKPEEKVEVENFIGQTCGTGCTTTRNYKLSFEEVENDAAAGTIIAQNIAPGTMVNPQTIIKLTVSKGKPQPKMCKARFELIKPGYGIDYQTTVNEINSAYSAFKVSIITVQDEVNNPDEFDGKIKSISPFADELECGSTITFEVYKKGSN